MNSKIVLTALIFGLALTSYGYASSIPAKTNINPQEENTISSIEETEIIASSQYSTTNSSEESGNIKSNQIAQNNVCTFNENTANIRLTKIEPCNNKVVPVKTIISGNITDPKAKVWLVVYPLESGGCFIQDGPIPVDTNKKFKGLSYFGNDQFGRGQLFQVQAIISNKSLPTGIKLELSDCPRPDTKSSELITVTRQ